MRFLISLIVNGVGLWITTLILAPHVRVETYADGAFPTILTYALVALLFGVVNGVIGTVVRIVAFPLYLLTLGLLALIVNGLLLLLVAWISGLFSFGLSIDSFGWGVLGAIVLGVISWLLGLILRPLSRRR